MSARSSFLPTTAIVVVALLWAANFWISKPVLAVIDPLVFNALRFTLATACLAPLVLRDLHRVPRAPAIALGLAGHFTFQTGFILGLADTTTGSAALMGATAPIWIAVLATVFLREPCSRREAVGLGVALAGTALVTLSGRDLELGEHALRGNLLTAVGAFGWAAYTAFSRPLLARAGALPFTFVSMLAAVPALVAVAWPNRPRTPDGGTLAALAALEFEVWLAIVYSGALATGLAYALWNWAVKAVGAVRVGLVSYLVPVVTLVGGVLLLREPVTLRQLVGGALVLGGLAWGTTARSRPLARQVDGAA